MKEGKIYSWFMARWEKKRWEINFKVKNIFEIHTIISDGSS
jgi:hypothetical protein